MKISHLITKLKKLDPDALVVLSKDPEGNGFDICSDVVEGYKFDREEREIGLESLTEQAVEDGYSEEDVMEDGERCVVLWP
jgi:hypothetical protein